MSDKKSVTVTIYGNEYTLKGDADPAYITDLAKFVDSKMSEIGKKSGAPAAKVAILAAMNIADELHRIEKSKAEVARMFEAAEKNLLVMKTASEGSLKHSMDLKVQLESLQTELKHTREKIQTLEKELENVKAAEGKAKETAASAQSKLDSSNLEAGETKKELQSVKDQVEELKGKLSEAEKAAREAKEGSERNNADLKKELSQKQEELETVQATLDKMKTEFEKILQESDSSGPSFLPPEEEIRDLFKKIDGVIET